MQSIKLTLASLALLLAACSPAATAQTPTAPVAPATVAATTEAAANPTPIVTVANVPITNTTVATVENISTAATVQDTQTTTQVAAATTNIAATPAGVAAALAQTEAYDNPASPVDLLASYYNAINRQEYERAFGYWEEAPLDYDAFANGYTNTASVQVIVQPPTRIEGAAGSLYAEIATVLIAQHHDGSVHSFAGCVVTRKSNVAPPDSPEADVWHLYQARLAEVANNANIPALLAEGCAS